MAAPTSALRALRPAVPDLLLMLRMGAADELLQVRVSFVVKLLLYPDLGSVVAIHRRILDRPEKPFLNRLWRSLVLADLFEQVDLLVRARVGKRLGEFVAAHFVDRGQSFTPDLFGRFG